MTRDLMRSDGSSRTRPNGFSLLECLVVQMQLEQRTRHGGRVRSQGVG